jgi:cobyrinic acid a,c-diamide synthase
MREKHIPALLMAAPQSGSGKTTITCGILAALKKRGLKVQAYKVGPDYIDPGYLTAASGRPAHNLDTWLTGTDVMKRIFAETAMDADIAIAEGAMGLYDGGKNGAGSSAEIAKELGVPVMLVIDAKAMGESAAALAVGFREYDKDIDIAGVLLNRLGSDSHRRIITEAMKRAGMPVAGAVPRDGSVSVAERHLGLLPEEENEDKGRLDTLAAIIEKCVDLDFLLNAADKAAAIARTDGQRVFAAPKVRIAVAKDRAFSFYYPESLAELEKAGAEIVFFSPLTDIAVPEADGIIFGGGFPEMFASRLSANRSMLESVAAAAAAGMPIYAECGGFMYLTRGIVDFEGRLHRMAGVASAVCKMNDKLRTVGYVEATALRDNVLCGRGAVIRGHEFHFSSMDVECENFPNAFLFMKNRGGEKYEAGFSSGSVLASYLHLHFAGNPALAGEFVKSCLQYRASEAKTRRRT